MGEGVRKVPKECHVLFEFGPKVLKAGHISIYSDAEWNNTKHISVSFFVS